MRASALLILLVGWSATSMMAADDQWRDFAAPNKRYVVQLHEGHAIGNCAFNQARLVDQKTGKPIFNFEPESAPSAPIGGYEQDSVVWSADSRFVAVYFHSHRVGEPFVVRISGGAAVGCAVPDITLPHQKDPANDGRYVQSWLTPRHWLPDGVLLLEDSGIIQQQREDGFRILYAYAIRVGFDHKGNSALKSVKRLKFTKA